MCRIAYCHHIPRVSPARSVSRESGRQDRSLSQHTDTSASTRPSPARSSRSARTSPVRSVRSAKSLSGSVRLNTAGESPARSFRSVRASPQRNTIFAPFDYHRADVSSEKEPEELADVLPSPPQQESEKSLEKRLQRLSLSPGDSGQETQSDRTVSSSNSSNLSLSFSSSSHNSSDNDDTPEEKIVHSYIASRGQREREMEIYEVKPVKHYHFGQIN